MNVETISLKEIKIKQIFDYINNIKDSCDEQYTDFFYCPNKCNINDIKDAMDNIIFPEYKDLEGYLIFIDPINIANWSHTCCYEFLCENGEVIINNKANWFPNSSIDIIEINIK